MTANIHCLLIMAVITRSIAFGRGGTIHLRGYAVSDRFLVSYRTATLPLPSSHSSSTSSSLLSIRGGSQRYSSSASTSAYNNELLDFSLPLSFNNERKDDVTSALQSVYAACKVTRYVQPTSSRNVATISKEDDSPVTIGDFGSQAIALYHLHNRFPNDMFIAEEGTDTLVAEEDLLSKVYDSINHESFQLDRKQILTSIDYGQGIDTEQNEKQSTNRIWCLDPIDGTKGFLRGRVEGGQYCVALALIEDGVPVVSILGCPNLPLASTPTTKTAPYGIWSKEEEEDSEHMFSTQRGCLFVAVKGCGCYEIPLHIIEQYLLGEDTATSHADAWSKLHVTPNDGSSKPLSQAKFCLGVERSFSDPKGIVLKVAELIHGPDALITDDDGIQDIEESLRIDGQGKYGLLARGDGELFLRLPKDNYVDWVWDVAAGWLVLKEAGGDMTDVNGQQVDFSGIGGVKRRAKLPDHISGIFGSCGGIFHKALVESYEKVVQQTS